MSNLWGQTKPHTTEQRNSKQVAEGQIQVSFCSHSSEHTMIHISFHLNYW